MSRPEIPLETHKAVHEAVAVASWHMKKREFKAAHSRARELLPVLARYAQLKCFSAIADIFVAATLELAREVLEAGDVEGPRRLIEAALTDLGTVDWPNEVAVLRSAAAALDVVDVVLARSMRSYVVKEVAEA